MNLIPRVFVAAVFVAASSAAWGLEIDPKVPPEINIGGSVIISADFLSENRNAGDSHGSSALTPSDSSLLFRFSKYLFTDKDYGFAVFGLRVPEDGTDLKDDVYIHQIHAGIGGRRYELLFGRTRLTNTLISFPTVREEDLLEYTHVANGQSNAEADEYQIFGGLVRGTYRFSQYGMVGAAVTARTETDPADLTTNPRKSSSDFNGASFLVAYDAPEAIKFGRGFRFAGVGLDYQRLDAMGASPKDTKTAFIAAITYNVSDNPERTLVFDLQGIVDLGARVTSLGDRFERNRAKNVSIAAALRYGHRPYLQTRWFAGIAAGWKKYDEFRDAVSFTVAPNYLYRLGSGVDFTAQYVYRKNRGELAAAKGIDSEQEFVIGLVFAFDATINETVGESRSILNLEHNMLDIGPSGGGH